LLLLLLLLLPGSLYGATLSAAATCCACIPTPSPPLLEPEGHTDHMCCQIKGQSKLTKTCNLRKPRKPHETIILPEACPTIVTLLFSHLHLRL
jgi:hypothetical protein